MISIGLKELRIGNYLKAQWQDDEVHEGIVKVECIDDIGVTEFCVWASGKETKEIEEYDSLKPIEISSDWLKNFGFKKGHFGFVKDGILFNHGPGLTLLFDYGTDFRTKINYVHQLQNLFFALTGTDLEFKAN